MQKLQRIDAGEIAPSTISPSPSLISLEVTVPTAEVDEEEVLVKQIAKAKKVADLRRQLAEAQGAFEEPPPSRSNWNPLSRN